MSLPLPKARVEGLLVEELAGEVLLYDTARDKAHCLNRAAALVWRACDGKRGLQAHARLLHQQLGLPEDERIAQLAIDALAKAHLLEEGWVPGGGEGRLTRRQLVRRIGLALASLPLVSSIAAPEAHAAAASCLPTGAPCSKNRDCCSNHCGKTTGLCE